MTTTFLVPNFDKSIRNKINKHVDVKWKHTLTNTSRGYHRAVASNGFPSKKDGVYVYATKIDNIGLVALNLGFTDQATFDSIRDDEGEDAYRSAISLNCCSGKRDPGPYWYFPCTVTQQAKEIISILTISNNGLKKKVQWIADGDEGDVENCTYEWNESDEDEDDDEDDAFDYEDYKSRNPGFGNGDGNEIFPCVTLASESQQVTMIPFDHIKFRSPKIEELLNEFIRPRLIIQAPSTSTAENDALINQLRNQIAWTQEAALTGRDRQIQALIQLIIELRRQGNLKDKQLLAKDRQVAGKDQVGGEKLMIEFRKELAAKDRLVEGLTHDFRHDIERSRIDLQLSHQQLELERAEHQKTRNLLHQIKMELKDVELYYLRLKQKESGQRRERESDNNDDEEEFKVKQEPGLEDET